jgi:hypothetical protein
MSLRSRVVTLAGSAVVVGGLALAPTVFTATPASAHTVMCTPSSPATESTAWTFVSVSVTGSSSSGGGIIASSTASSSSSAPPATTVTLVCN